MVCCPQMDSIRWLQNWYAAQCNGDWEHQYGVKIDTLDNPGWLVKIDLIGMPLANQQLQRIEREDDKLTWLNCRIENESFIGAGGPFSLLSICDVFREWVESPEAAPQR